MNEAPNTLRVFLIGPYESRVVLDYCSLGSDHERARVEMMRQLEARPLPQAQAVIERFERPGPDGQVQIQTGAYETWRTTSGDLGALGARDLEFDQWGGKSKEDRSFLRVDLEEPLEIPLEGLGSADLLAGPPQLREIQLTLHPYGIGLVQGVVELPLAAPLLGTHWASVMGDLLRGVIRQPSLVERIQRLDDVLLEAFAGVKKSLDLRSPLFPFDDLSESGDYGVPRWCHGMLLLDAPLETLNPFSFLRFCHPDLCDEQGLPRDMNIGGEGYVHLGWGDSLAVQLSARHLWFAKHVLQRLEYDYRAIQLFSRLLGERLEAYAGHSRQSLEATGRRMSWIDHARVELEFYRKSQAEFVSVMDPMAHHLYELTYRTWRLPQMRTDYTQKLDTLWMLREKGQLSVEKAENRYMNATLAIIGSLAFLSVFIDAGSYISEDGLADPEQQLRIRQVVLIAGVVLLLLSRQIYYLFSYLLARLGSTLGRLFDFSDSPRR